MKKIIKQFQVWVVEFDPSVGSEIQKTRPAVIVSNNSMNNNLHTVIVAPLTSTIKEYPSRIDIVFKNKMGQVALDQVKCVDKQRLRKKLGAIALEETEDIINVLRIIFDR